MRISLSNSIIDIKTVIIKRLKKPGCCAGLFFYSSNRAMFFISSSV
jgi:hypothetical protein